MRVYVQQDELLPYELTVKRPFEQLLLRDALVARLFPTRMTGEQKMWAAVLLQAIAEQDTRFVTLEGVPKHRAQRKKEQLAREAQEFVASPQFDEIANLAGLPADKLRTVAPERAAQAFRELGTGNMTRNFEPAAEEDELDFDELPTYALALEEVA
jgi:hypothetical protein